MGAYRVKAKNQEFDVIVNDGYDSIIAKEYDIHVDGNVYDYDNFKEFGRSKGFKLIIV